MRSVWVVVVVATLSPSPAGYADDLILRRHDRADAQYLELGRQFPQVAQLGDGLADGTLIGPTWILTAAHVARGMMRRRRTSVDIEGERFEAVAFYLHPDFRQMGPHDIALLRLDRPVRHVRPLSLYEGDEEEGRVAILVGHGATGTGAEAARIEDGLRRGATNRIEVADSRFLVFRFDAPREGTELEGVPGPGDSGGPALLEFDEGFVVVGVSSAGRSGPDGPGSYGSTDYFTRVAKHRDWIDAVLEGRMPPSAIDEIF